MKKLFAVLLMAVGTSATANTITALDTTCKLSLVETCDSTTCTQALKLNATTAISAEMDGGAFTEFNPDTVIVLEGPEMYTTFTLSQDPTYVQGNTAVTIEDVVSDSIQRRVVLDWTSGNLQFELSLKGKSIEIYPHFYPFFPFASEVTQKASVNEKDFYVVLEARNEVQLWELAGILHADGKHSLSENYKGSNSKVSRTFQLKTRGFSLLQE